jgi:hypothetical protein
MHKAYPLPAGSEPPSNPGADKLDQAACDARLQLDAIIDATVERLAVARQSEQWVNARHLRRAQALLSAAIKVEAGALAMEQAAHFLRREDR